MALQKQTAKVRLTTLSPVHVGSGQTLNKGIDFVIDNGKVGFIDLNKVVAFIGEDSIPRLTATIEKGESVLDFVRTRSSRVVLEDICSRVARAEGTGNNVSQLKEHYRTALQGVCIPGSSLKGAIKTAILVDIISQEYKEFKLPIVNYGNRWNDGNVEKQVFGSDATTKTTRFLHVGDIQFDGQPTVVYLMKIANQVFDGWNYKAQQVLTEAIPTGVSADFTIKLDKELFGEFKTKYPNTLANKSISFITGGYTELCALINENTDYLTSEELRVLSDKDFDDLAPGAIEELKGIRNQLRNLPDNSCVLRVGANSGWDFMTGAWMKYDYVKKQTDYSSFIRQARRRQYDEEILFPKTRKVSSNEDVFGFVKLTFDL